MFSFFKTREENILKSLSLDLSNFKFLSSRHSKYVKGVETATIDGCWKGIQINKNSKNDNSYSVTISTLDRQKNKWKGNVQMAINKLRLKNASSNKLELSGYGDDGMGVSFSDYGIAVVLENNIIVKVILKFFYRNTELHYYR
ncbi:MAG TPA: hypothetical protein VIV55_14445 [Flavobacterium sp.]